METRLPGIDAMLTTVAEHLYDHPKYYDLVFGSDWRAEFQFLTACFKQFSTRRVRTLFEPACGTGRLLFRLARAGYCVAGNDLNPRAVDYCNRRLARHGFRPTAVVGDMADFQLRRPVDAAFNLINSFRHLPTQEAAVGHLRCVSRALRPGGLFVLGLHLTPVAGVRCTEESWSARRGHLAVNSRMWSTHVDQRRRREEVSMTFDIYTPRHQFRLTEEITFRTYTAVQMRRLLSDQKDLELIDSFDFHYDINHPVAVDAQTEDVIYVLRRR